MYNCFIINQDISSKINVCRHVKDICMMSLVGFYLHPISSLYNRLCLYKLTERKSSKDNDTRIREEYGSGVDVCVK